MLIEETHPGQGSPPFDVGCNMIWRNLEQVAASQNLTFTKVCPVIKRGDLSGVFYTFAFRLNSEVTQITVHLEDILAASRLRQQMEGAMDAVG